MAKTSNKGITPDKIRDAMREHGPRMSLVARALKVSTQAIHYHLTKDKALADDWALARREHVEAAVETVMDIMRNPEAKDENRLRAAETTLKYLGGTFGISPAASTDLNFKSDTEGPVTFTLNINPDTTDDNG
jgi:AcrR family transcriptional regulator